MQSKARYLVGFAFLLKISFLFPSCFIHALLLNLLLCCCSIAEWQASNNTLETRQDTLPTDVELVQQLRDRNERALRHLYDNYARALQGVIFRIVQAEELTEELLQETFVKVWHNIASYDASKGRLYTWMLNIARNLAIDKVRSSDYKFQQQTQTIENSVHSINREYQDGFDPAHIDVKEIVDRLRPEQKELIDLIYFYGYTQAEAAAKLKMPLGTVKTRVRTAVSELRKIFRPNV